MGRPLPPTHPRHPTQVLSKVLLSTYKSLNTRRPSEGSNFPLLPFTVTLPSNLWKRKSNEWEMNRRTYISIFYHSPFTKSASGVIRIESHCHLLSCNAVLEASAHRTIHLSDSLLWGNRKTIHFLPRRVKTEHLLQCLTFWPSRDDTAWHNAAPLSCLCSIHS